MVDEPSAPFALHVDVFDRKTGNIRTLTGDDARKYLATVTDFYRAVQKNNAERKANQKRRAKPTAPKHGE